MTVNALAVFKFTVFFVVPSEVLTIIFTGGNFLPCLQLVWMHDFLAQLCVAQHQLWLVLQIS